MEIHNKGAKADRDRTLLIVSYNRMVQKFHTPRSKRLSTAEISRMTNTQIYQASKDLWNGATPRQQKRLAGELGLDVPKVSRWAKARNAIHNGRLSVGFFLSRLFAKGPDRA